MESKKEPLNSKNGFWLSEEQEVYPRVLQQVPRGVGCKVKEQHLIRLLRTRKEYYPAFPDKGTLDIEVWEEVKIFKGQWCFYRGPKLNNLGASQDWSPAHMG